VTPEDIIDVLAKAAAFDQRTIGKADVLAWHEVIGDLDRDDALTAVARFYGTVTERRLMPGDVRTLVAEIARERRRRPADVVAPGCFEPDEAARRKLTLSEDGRAALPITDGTETDRTAELKALAKEHFREVLPEGDPDSLRFGHGYWRQEQAAWKRQQAAEPNPHFNPDLVRPVDWQRTNRQPAGAWWESEAKREEHARAELDRLGRLRPPTSDGETS
jgi:hypothetical protein